MYRSFQCGYFPPYIDNSLASAPGCSYHRALPSGLYYITPYPPVIDSSEYLPYDTIAAFIRSFPRVDVVRTYYDTVVTRLTDVPGFTDQTNLRKRVSCVQYQKDFNPNIGTANYDYATHYSYDAQGNVQTLTHDYPQLAEYRRQYTRVDYDYDVISGKVNMLSYNRGFPDQFYQRYRYDADNRITEVSTSADGYLWQRDARYSYYDHGPLARAELGEYRVQGLDYAYTIQGWLKALNGDSLNHHYDMGEDGRPGTITATDAVAHTIDYFAGDYSAISGRQVQHTTSPLRNLYNGNIVGQTVAIDTLQRLYKQYVYDQMNRLLKADYATIDAATGAQTGISDYHNRYAYDADGNITALQRWGNNTGSGATVMDSLRYHYQGLHNDLLEDVTDSAANVYTNDLKQHLTPTFRYTYDAIGNLSSNRESGQDSIYWNLYNKVHLVNNQTDSSTLRYDYDGMGNRVGKHYVKEDAANHGYIDRAEYYIRDAQGNILATYRGYSRSGNINSYKELALSAHDVYGSSRLGQRNYFGTEVGVSIDHGTLLEGLYDTARFYARMPWYSLDYQDVIDKDYTEPWGHTWLLPGYAKHTVGCAQYEVTDHLGNVLATLSDKRAGHSFAGTLSAGSVVGITAYQPVVSSLYDYYPFGQYMPGRYTSDTATHCFSTTYSGMGNRVLMKQHKMRTALATYTGGAYITALPGGGLGGTVSSGLSDIFFITTTAAPDAVSFDVSGVSVYGDHITVRIGSASGLHEIAVHETGSGTPLGAYTVTPSVPATTAVVPLSPVPHSTSLTITITALGSTPGALDTITFYLPRDTTVPTNIASNVCTGGGYRYGYNTQIKENEIAGVGNHYSALYWEYDPRVARRWNVDPFDKAWEADFSTFSNNPIIFVDPNGNTDYFNTSGHKIGTDGKPNSVKLIVFERQTVRSIETQMKKNKVAFLASEQLKNTHLVPSREVLDKYDEVFSLTKRGNATEYGFMAGTKADGTQISTSIGAGVAVSNDLPRYNPANAGNSTEFGVAGGVNPYIIHSHPNVLKYTPNDYEEYSTTGEGPSDRDLDFKGSNYAEVVLEIQSNNRNEPSAKDQAIARGALGRWVNRTDSKEDYISFFNDRKKFHRYKYSEYKEVVKKVNETH